MRRVLLSLCFLIGMAANARADVVGYPPATCPPGSTPDTCHGGPHCAIRLCQANTDCFTGQECKPIQACLGTLNCQGRPLPADAAPPLRKIMKSACPSSGICADGQACQTENLCVSPGSDSTGTTTANATSQQTSRATSTSTGTAQGTSTDGAKLGDSGCSCRIGDWASAKSFGPWLLAGVFGAVVTLVRRRPRG